MKESEIKTALLDAAFAYGRTGEDAHVERIRELVAMFDGRRSAKYQITPHAVARYMQRSGCKSRARAENAIKNMLDNAEEMEVKDRWKAVQIINHNFEDALYFQCSQWLFVVSNGWVVTCHLAEAKRWRKLEEAQTGEGFFNSDGRTYAKSET